MLKRVYSEQDLDSILATVETAFAEDLQKAELQLAKSEKPEEKIEKAEVEKCGDMSVAKKEDEDDCDYNDDDKEELAKMYGSMKKGELKAHYKAVKKHMYKDEMKKSEETEVQTEKVEPKVEETSLLKAELEAKGQAIEELKKSNEELKANFEQFVAQLSSKIVKPSAPKQKAITELAVIQKNEQTEEKKEVKLTAKEISTVLSRKAIDQSLAKSDKELIKNYYSGTVALDKIQHLLK